MKLTRSIANLFRLTGFALVLALFAGPLWAEQHPAIQQTPASPPHYAVVDLGTLGGSFGLAYGINDRWQVDGFANLPGDMAQHAFVFANGVMTISAPWAADRTAWRTKAPVRPCRLLGWPKLRRWIPMARIFAATATTLSVWGSPGGAG